MLVTDRLFFPVVVGDEEDVKGAHEDTDDVGDGHGVADDGGDAHGVADNFGDAHGIADNGVDAHGVADDGGDAHVVAEGAPTASSTSWVATRGLGRVCGYDDRASGIGGANWDEVGPCAGRGEGDDVSCGQGVEDEFGGGHGDCDGTRCASGAHREEDELWDELMSFF